MNFGSPPREETGSLQVANTSKYATQSLRSKSLHETQNPALVDCLCLGILEGAQNKQTKQKTVSQLDLLRLTPTPL